MKKARRTELHGRTKHDVDLLWESLRDKIDTWRIGFDRKSPFEITTFDGKTIACGGGFTGSSQAVFWGGYIEPFLRDGIVRILESTRKRASETGTGSARFLNEAAGLLDRVIESVYQHMADVDHALQTKGHQLMANPPSYIRRDVSENIEHMRHFLAAQVRAAKAQSGPRYSRQALLAWVYAHPILSVCLLIVMLAAGAATLIRPFLELREDLSEASRQPEDTASLLEESNDDDIESTDSGTAATVPEQSDHASSQDTDGMVQKELQIPIIVELILYDKIENYAAYLSEPTVEGIRFGAVPVQDDPYVFAILVGGAIEVKVNGQRAQTNSFGGSEELDWTSQLPEGVLYQVRLRQGDSFEAETAESMVTVRLTKLPPMNRVREGRYYPAGRAEFLAAIQPKVPDQD